MKKGWLLLLLISLGLNLGLGMRLVRSGPGNPPPIGNARWGGPDGKPRWERPAPGDSTAWRRVMGRRMDHLARQLDLSPEQLDHFREAQGVTFRRLQAPRRALLRARTQLRDLMAAEKVDRVAVRRAMAELGRRQAVVDSLVAETVVGELQVLDPDQRLRYLDFLPIAAGHGPGRGPGRAGGGRRGGGR